APASAAAIAARGAGRPERDRAARSAVSAARPSSVEDEHLGTWCREVGLACLRGIRLARYAQRTHRPPPPRSPPAARPRRPTIAASPPCGGHDDAIAPAFLRRIQGAIGGVDP